MRYTGEKTKQESIKKIHEYAERWGIGNALETLVEEVLNNPAQSDFDIVCDEAEEVEMVSGENRNRVLENFHEKFDYDSWERNNPKITIMFNTLVDELLVENLTEHDLEMLAVQMWEIQWGDIEYTDSIRGRNGNLKRHSKIREVGKPSCRTKLGSSIQFQSLERIMRADNNYHQQSV